MKYNLLLLSTMVFATGICSSSIDTRKQFFTDKDTYSSIAICPEMSTKDDQPPNFNLNNYIKPYNTPAEEQKYCLKEWIRRKKQSSLQYFRQIIKNSIGNDSTLQAANRGKHTTHQVILDASKPKLYKLKIIKSNLSTHSILRPIYPTEDTLDKQKPLQHFYKRLNTIKVNVDVLPTTKKESTQHSHLIPTSPVSVVPRQKNSEAESIFLSSTLIATQLESFKRMQYTQRSSRYNRTESIENVQSTTTGLLDNESGLEKRRVSFKVKLNSLESPVPFTDDSPCKHDSF
ncbi:hypothetical protein BDF14DRAFT_1996846 [Spinellus fusiger]|nr:hypothetical protein BDF14DRAFT_1996846 [Spinellus fusiger]